MAKYRKIDPRIWNDEKFYSATLSCQHLFLFILTHPQMTPVGAMRTTLSGLSEELDWKEKAFPQAFSDAFQEGVQKGFWKYDRRAKILVVPKFIKYNKPESPNVVKAWVGCWDDIPESKLKSELYHILKGYVEGYKEAFIEAFEQAFAEVIPEDYTESGAGAGAGTEEEHKEDKSSLSADKPPTCPHIEIIEAYHAALPELPRILSPRWPGSQSERNLRARWKENSEHQSVEWWARFFEVVRTNPHWMGENKRGWTADLHWLIKRSNFDKVMQRWANMAKQS